MEKLLEFLKKNNIEFYENFDLSLISSIKLGTKAKTIIYPHNKTEFKLILIKLSKLKLYFRVFGNLSNVLFVQDIDFPIVLTSKMVAEISIDGLRVTASAGVMLPKFCEVLKNNNLSGIEGLLNIPATLGGAIISNAGAFGYSISSHLESVNVFSGGKVIKINRNDIKFRYHLSNLTGLIIIDATFLFENKKEYDIIKLSNEFTYKRNKSQPSGLSLGSVYKKVNEKSAGFYIERCGLKGTRVGGIVVSNKHANFFINDKNGTIADFLMLASLVENTVSNQFGVALEFEIEKVGNKDEFNSRLSHPFKV